MLWGFLYLDAHLRFSLPFFVWVVFCNTNPSTYNGYQKGLKCVSFICVLFLMDVCTSILLFESYNLGELTIPSFSIIVVYDHTFAVMQFFHLMDASISVAQVISFRSQILYEAIYKVGVGSCRS